MRDNPWLVTVFATVVAGLSTFAFVSSAQGFPLIFNDPLHQSDTGDTDYTAVDLAQAASDIAPGAILRFSVSWAGVQPYCLTALGQETTSRSTCETPGPYDWNWYDLESDLNSISSYLENGSIKLLPVVQQAPGWAIGYGDTADPESNSDGYNPEYPDMPPGGDSTALGWWQQFNDALVTWIETNYGKSSLAGVEEWNEEDNYPISWSLEPDDQTTMASRYSQVLCAGYAGVRDADSSLPVLFGGFNPTDTSYLTDAFTSPLANIKNCMTAIAIHPYNIEGSTWLAPNTAGSPFEAGPGDVEGVASSESDPNVPLWITEFGYPVLNPPTESDAASWDAEAYQMAPSLEDVQAMGIHTIFDQPSGGFQICAGPGDPLAAATALKQAVSGNDETVASC